MSPIEIGQQLAHYEILAKIGEGGMGEVYRARDSKLGREVALKVLPAGFGADARRRARFEQEAKAVAALNHPNIVTLHSIEEADGVRFLTMELLEGETLAKTIPPGGIDPATLLDLAVPIIDALGAAHEKGITHRDVKPQNILVTRDGRPKVLDFGLARTTPADASSEDDATAMKTAEGVIVGTVSYMSPEQALGDEVDPRSDIFSSGIVLYEMVTGRRPFEGNTSTKLIDQLIHAEPQPIAPSGDRTREELARIINKCLQKDRERRYQSARELRIDLDNLRSGATTASTVREAHHAATHPRALRCAAVAALAVIAALAIESSGTRPRTRPPRSRETQRR